jgi:hypothetical protein
MLKNRRKNQMLNWSFETQNKQVQHYCHNFRNLGCQTILVPWPSEWQECYHVTLTKEPGRQRVQLHVQPWIAPPLPFAVATPCNSEWFNTKHSTDTHSICSVFHFYINSDLKSERKPHSKLCILIQITHTETFYKSTRLYSSCIQQSNKFGEDIQETYLYRLSMQNVPKQIAGYKSP